ncbi:NifB/NifX family molybdenum-iron cluster-binding protein [Ruminococcus sp. OA3]|uniref:NifB/NifX family molybdenum-iron cluster-binding protein n=1 Tax=Ruminococcus sp. OA3 TaxID=2914164 RepID=UPI001F05AF97|nr:NifB/NifX family molybdenum-iron cluster-binding protein [Ruminococcus sp. OA3]MCH1982329.1 NifB/NifX family molybdenum-iron cluster-binding protein [Ruminococcus sp. OA3]
MKIAVTYEEGKVFQHFGHTEKFKVYEAENGKVVSSEVVDTNGNGHGALADFLAEKAVKVLICGGIGQGARQALAQAGIELYPGVNGEADQAVHEFLNDNLSYDPDTVCSHHEHHGECAGGNCSH